MRGYRVTFLGRRVYRDQVDVREDLRGTLVLLDRWTRGARRPTSRAPICDAVRAGLASVTPLGLDLTHARLIGELVDWQVGNFVHEAIERAKS